MLGEPQSIAFQVVTHHVTDNEDHDGLAELALNARDVLLGVLDDESLDFTLSKEEIGELPTSPIKPTSSRSKRGADEPLPESRWNYAVKLFLVRDLFTITRAVFTPEAFAELAESVLRYLNSHEEALVGDVQCADEVREQWACMCADAAFACDLSILQAFWDNNLRKGRRDSEWDADVKREVWLAFVDRWDSGDANGSLSWEAGVVLLCAPFVEPSYWDMEGEDVDRWDAFLRRAIDAALDHGMDAASLVDQVAGAVAENLSPSAISAIRVADLLLSNVEVAEARQVPTETIEFANDTLNAAYPPEPRNKVMCMWLIRSLTRVIDACPQVLCLSLLELLVDGISTWVMDDYQICSEEEYSADVRCFFVVVKAF